MIREKSCGAVIFSEAGQMRVYLVEKMLKGHQSLCKGHVEENETERETAAREIRCTAFPDAWKPEEWRR